MGRAVGFGFSPKWFPFDVENKKNTLKEKHPQEKNTQFGGGLSENYLHEAKQVTVACPLGSSFAFDHIDSLDV